MCQERVLLTKATYYNVSESLLLAQDNRLTLAKSWFNQQCCCSEVLPMTPKTRPIFNRLQYTLLNHSSVKSRQLTMSVECAERQQGMDLMSKDQ